MMDGMDRRFRLLCVDLVRILSRFCYFGYGQLSCIKHLRPGYPEL
jgi:hypothetical protein